MIEDIDKKSNNPIANSVDQKNAIKSSSSRDKDKKENNNNPNANLNNLNNPQINENFGTVNKDYRTNLSTNPNFSSNQYNTNSNFMRGKN